MVEREGNGGGARLEPGVTLRLEPGVDARTAPRWEIRHILPGDVKVLEPVDGGQYVITASATGCLILVNPDPRFMNIMHQCEVVTHSARTTAYANMIDLAVHDAITDALGRASDASVAFIKAAHGEPFFTDEEAA